MGNGLGMHGRCFAVSGQACSFVNLNVAGGIPLLKRNGRFTSHAFTMIEMLVVVCILAAMAGLVVPLMGTTQDDSMRNVTIASMGAVRDAIMGASTTPGYYQDMKYVNGIAPSNKAPQWIRDLFVRPRRDGMRSAPTDLEVDLVPEYDPATRKGWRGPYLNTTTDKYVVDNANNFTTAYGFQDMDGIDPDTSDPAVLDAWRRPIVLQVFDPASLDDVRLVSAGPNGVIDTDPAKDRAALQAAGVGDDVVLFLRPSVTP
jgi:prepilin-type N-terminal cleavage/methylation domain-containing protein